MTDKKRTKSLKERADELVQGVLEVLENLFPGPEPVLIPIPIRRRRRR